jgi:hypothetical protein
MCLRETEERAFNKEHIFPDSIGGHVCFFRVCTVCNGILGSSVDHHLTDHVLIEGRRMVLGLRGKKGRVPNPLSHGVLRDDPEQHVRLELPADGGPLKVYTPPKPKLTKAPDGSSKLEVWIDQKDAKRLPKIANTVLTRAGLAALSDDQIAALQTTKTTEGPWVSINFDVDTVQYKRAIIKIAYELAWRWLGDPYLDDPTAAALRACLFAPGRWDDGERVGGMIGLCTRTPMFPQWQDNADAHLSFITTSEQTAVVVYVRVFDIFEGQVVVSRNVDRYPDYVPMFLCNDAVSAEVREVALADECERIDRLEDEAMRE